MLLVIFGAGASYDSVDTTAVREIQTLEQFRPPLAKDLFADRREFNAAIDAFPQCASRVLHLRRAARQPDFDVEKELQALRDQADHYPPARIELAAIQFYLQRVLTKCGELWGNESWGLTNYTELLGRVDRWRLPRQETVLLATFNYDLLLDRAVQRFPVSLHLNDIDSYVSATPYKLFKPHGSVNWAQVTEWEIPQSGFGNDEIRTFLIEHVDEVAPTPEYVVTAGPLVGRAALPGAGTPTSVGALPAISIPVAEKSDFACPETHLAQLDRNIASVTHVLCVGWRGAERHFLERFMTKLGRVKVLVVSGDANDAHRTRDSLSDWVQGGSLTSSSERGFTAFLATQELDEFLDL